MTPGKIYSANLGVEAKLWLTADKLRNHLDAVEEADFVDCIVALPGQLFSRTPYWNN